MYSDQQASKLSDGPCTRRDDGLPRDKKMLLLAHSPLSPPSMMVSILDARDPDLLEFLTCYKLQNPITNSRQIGTLWKQINLKTNISVTLQ